MILICLALSLALLLLAGAMVGLTAAVVDMVLEDDDEWPN